MKTRPIIPTVLAATIALCGCATEKSANPLSPSVSGPIAGVEIQAPQPVEPAAGAKVRTDGPPVTLVIQNASTSGVRPLSYTFEIGLDAAFAEVVLSKKGVQPGANSQTSFQVPDPLQSGRTYYWRTRAEDGANASPYSPVRFFLVVEPPVLSTPAPSSPADGSRVDSLRPELRVTNADRRGDVGAVRYAFEVSSSSNFGSIAASGTADEEPGSTRWTVESTLENNRTYYWRARAVEPTTQGPWSHTWSFLTPLAAAPPPPPPPSGGGNPPGTSCPLPSGNGEPNPTEGAALVACVKDDLVRRGFNLSGPCGAFEITLRVTWALRDRGARLERYNGTNCQGYSHDIILFMPQGTSVDMLGGAGNSNNPQWSVYSEKIPNAPWGYPWNPDGGF